MDDVIYVGMPACEEHLKSKYLVFESNCDGDLDGYLRGLAARSRASGRDLEPLCGIPRRDAIWQAFIDYMKACQLETTFFFAAVNDKSVPETLKRCRRSARLPTSLRPTREWSRRGCRESSPFWQLAESGAVPKPGSIRRSREIKTGGQNE